MGGRLNRGTDMLTTKARDTLKNAICLPDFDHLAYAASDDIRVMAELLEAGVIKSINKGGTIRFVGLVEPEFLNQIDRSSQQ